MEVPVLFEDENLIAANKPAGLSSIAERDLTKITVLKKMEDLCNRKLYIVHRLDKEVSGIILFAKTPAMHAYLNSQFFNRSVCKEYIAVVHGCVSFKSLDVNLGIRQFGSGRMGIDSVKGKESLTQLRCIEKTQSFSYLSVTPYTGRRHQIRVHCYSCGHPIVGDRFYGEKQLQLQFPSLLLHAYKIVFALPSSQLVTLTVHPPEIFQNFLFNQRLVRNI